MSNRYKGGVISATPPTLVAGAGASGTWTLEQQMQATAAGLWPVNGPFYIEDVFSTYLYAGNDSTQTIANNINISTKGALVWVKGRSGTYGVWDHTLITTPISNTVALSSNTTGNTFGLGASAFSPTTTGFNLNTASASLNNNGTNYVSWTFRKQPKFFDVVTYTGNGSARTIAHSLGATPGCIIVKDTTNAGSNWAVYHRSLNAFRFMSLNTATGETISSDYWNNTEPTSTQFTVGTNGNVNQSGATFVAYLFAHDAGGFGLLGTDNVITCGQFDTNGAGSATVDLGYEPQWLLVKKRDFGGWWITDTMRGMTVATSSNVKALFAQSSAAESTGYEAKPNATGFTVGPSSDLGNSVTCIYIAIRRGPMKVPTSGTSVFEPKTMSATQANLSITGVGFPPDLVINGVRSNANYGQQVTDRLRGVTKQVFTEYDSAENTTNGTAVVSLNMNGISLGADTAGTGWNAYSGYTSVKWMFGRAPSFFDEVCYTGTNSGGSSQTISHNLGVAPELTIFKKRAAVSNWTVAMPAIGGNAVSLNLNDVGASSNIQFIDTYGASSITTASGYDTISENTTTYVAYLFATCAGVSKVGSYTGTGALQTINCGFAAGARFVLIKRTDSTGDWYTYDSARGITSGNDPYLLLNSAAAEVTGTNYVDTTSVGFQVTAAAPAGLNASGGTYIFLAIA